MKRARSRAVPAWEGETTWRALTYGGVGINFTDPVRLKTYRDSVRRIMARGPYDVSLTNHPGMAKVFPRARELAARLPGESHPFVDPAAMAVFLEQRLTAVRQAAGVNPWPSQNHEDQTCVNEPVHHRPQKQTETLDDPMIQNYDSVFCKNNEALRQGRRERRTTMGQIGWRMGMLVVVTLALGGAQDGLYAAEETTEDDSPWSNDTDLSIVVTEGNSITSTVGFKNTLRRDGKKSWFAMKLDSLRSETADDRFVILAPGVEWLPGAVPPPSATRTIEPDLEPDIERYFIEGKYGRQISNTREWNLGGSWERNEDAGILNRYIAFAGLGNAWKKEEGLEFSTAYGLSYTDREEEEPDPEKDNSFAGIRLSLRFLKEIGKVTVFENDFTSNLSLKDTSDYSLDMTNALRVKVSDHFSLKVSLQWLFESEPALEEVDLKAFVEIIDPDGVPGSGDEFFRTVSSGGVEIELGDADIRKEQLDTIFRTSLVINF